MPTGSGELATPKGDRRTRAVKAGDVTRPIAATTAQFLAGRQQRNETLGA
jgi:hypothetical protein